MDIQVGCGRHQEQYAALAKEQARVLDEAEKQFGRKYRGVTQNRDDLVLRIRDQQKQVDQETRGWTTRAVTDCVCCWGVAARQIRDQQKQIDQENTDKFRKLTQLHFDEVADLHRQLNQETHKLQEARDRAAALEAAKAQEVNAMRAQFEAATRAMLAKERQFSENLRSMEDRYKAREAEIRELQTALADLQAAAEKMKEEFAQETALHQQTTGQLRDQTRALAEQLTAERQRNQATSQQVSETRLSLQQEAHQRAILGEEARLKASEIQRLLRENDDLRAELRRYDKILYGGTKQRHSTPVACIRFFVVMICAQEFSMMEVVAQLVGLCFPAYRSYLAITSSKKEDDTEWLIYWVAFAILEFIQYSCFFIFSYLPFFSFVKMAFYAYLQLGGAKQLFVKYLDPYFRSQKGNIDRAVKQANESFVQVAGMTTTQASTLVQGVTTAVTMTQQLGPQQQ
ncbi:putative receptor expression-enhancing protein 5/6 [Paratrimastix pyriformis]|uniref:Receptor expression-enhancing protein 5/6 n=1 Tax=Paratrimastix pyriformis TaxID=342808 RepID=A0ABQ8UJ66_9EUKA|nr:putative receptor expression-enhancing protein 5/6 [Paratrimastix pyriformis]